MKKTLLSIISLLLLGAIFTISALAISPSQIYIYKETPSNVKITGSLHSSSPTGTYIRTSTPLTRVDVINNASVTFEMNGRLYARLYTNYTAAPTSGTLKVNIMSDSFVEPGNYISYQRIFEESERIIKVGSQHEVVFYDGSDHILTQGQYLSNGTFVRDTAADSIY